MRSSFQMVTPVSSTSSFDTWIWQTESWQSLWKAYGMNAWTVGLAEGDDLRSYALLQESSPLTMSTYWGRSAHWVDRLTIKGFKSLEVLNGPVVLNPEVAEDIHQAFSEYLASLQDKQRYYSVVVRPTYFSEGPSLEALETIYGSHGFVAERHHTFVARTSGSLGEIRKRIASKRRTKVNKARREGVIVDAVSGHEGVERYWKVRCENWKRNGQEIVPLKHFIDTWDVLWRDSATQIFIARKDDHDLAAQTLFTCGKDIALVGVAVSDYSISNSLPGNDYLQWYVLKWAHENGFANVDYVGATPDTDDPKLRGIHSFKKSWGGELIEHVVFRRVRNNLLSRLKQLLDDPVLAAKALIRRARQMMGRG
ncbi:MAG: peptidoglycan bridge formation glycyltransferase FemA/FemB family protein [Pseudodesulfovibrio sp.]|nr:peptidoglycan bridge formation glycyltransferase FemA/FemB family protein [Pseudodesulfovibrio sp.]